MNFWEKNITCPKKVFFDQIWGVQRGVKRVFKLGGMPPSLSCQLGVYSTVPALD